MAKVNEKIYEVTLEEFVGDEEHIDVNFVKAYMELASYHPIQNQTSKEPAASKQIYFESLNKALERFQKKDTLGAFKSVNQFIHCFDLAVLDYAFVTHGLLEEDVRQIAFELELIESKEAYSVFEKVAAEICKHLEHVPEEDSNNEEYESELQG